MHNQARLRHQSNIFSVWSIVPTRAHEVCGNVLRVDHTVRKKSIYSDKPQNICYTKQETQSRKTRIAANELQPETGGTVPHSPSIWITNFFAFPMP